MRTRPPVGAKVIVKYREDGRTPARSDTEIQWRLGAVGTVMSHGTPGPCVRVEFREPGHRPRTCGIFYSRLELVDALLTPVPLCRAVDML